MMEQKKCPCCGVKFSTDKETQKYCSRKCSVKHRKRNKARQKLKRMWRICSNPRCNDWNDEPEHIAVPYDILEEKEKSFVCYRAGWHQKNVLAKREFFDTKEECEEEIRRRYKQYVDSITK